MSAIRLLTLANLVAGLAASGVVASDDTMAKVGLLGLDMRECGNEPLRPGLGEPDYLYGRNVVVEYRHGGGRYDGLQAAADALVQPTPM